MLSFLYFASFSSHMTTLLLIHSILSLHYHTKHHDATIPYPISCLNISLFVISITVTDSHSLAISSPESCLCPLAGPLITNLRFQNKTVTPDILEGVSLFPYLITHPSVLCFSCTRRSMDDDEYAKLIRRMNPPRVVIDNNASEEATVIQVDSVNKHGTLLEVVQVLTDMNLVIKKAYISSDGGWFMDVFKVIDQDGNKIRDTQVLDYIQRRIETNAGWFIPPLRSSVGVMPSDEHTMIELAGTDRPGLLSEVSAVLADLHCNVVNAEIWTHNTRAAAVIHVTDNSTNSAITDPIRLSTIKELLCNVVRTNSGSRAAKTVFSCSDTHRERRLHQIMFDDRDYEGVKRARTSASRPSVTLTNIEKDYTVVTMRSRDRPKLVFDVVCTLTDMQYVVFHGMVSTEPVEAYQEFYIRHVDGLPINSEAEQERVIKCLEAAIERRASEGLELELSAEDRVGLLSDITRTFRENSLTIVRAEISTREGKAKDTFFVTDVTGNPVESKIVESIREEIGVSKLKVKKEERCGVERNRPWQETRVGYLINNIFKGKSLQSFKLLNISHS